MGGSEEAAFEMRKSEGLGFDLKNMKNDQKTDGVVMESRFSLSVTDSSSKTIEKETRFRITAFRAFNDTKIESKYAKTSIKNMNGILAIILYMIPFTGIMIALIRGSLEFDIRLKSFLLVIVGLYFMICITALAILLVNIAMGCMKRTSPFNALFRIFMEFYTFIPILGISSIIEIMGDYKLSGFNRSFYQTKMTFFYGLPFYYIFKYQLPVMVILEISAIIGTGVMNKQNLLYFIVNGGEYLVQWLIWLIIKYVDDAKSRRLFSVSARIELCNTRLNNVRENTRIMILSVVPFKELADCLQTAVAKRHKNRGRVYMKSVAYKNAILIQTDIVGFTNYCDNNTPDDVITLLRGVFENIDKVTTKSRFRTLTTAGDSCTIFYLSKNTDAEPTDHECKMACSVAQDIILKSHHDYNLRVGVCCERLGCVLRNGSRLMLNVYGRSTELVEYLQTVAPVNKILICHVINKGNCAHITKDLKFLDNITTISHMELQRVDKHILPPKWYIMDDGEYHPIFRIDPSNDLSENQQQQQHQQYEIREKNINGFVDTESKAAVTRYVKLKNFVLKNSASILSYFEIVKLIRYIKKGKDGDVIKTIWAYMHFLADSSGWTSIITMIAILIYMVAGLLSYYTLSPNKFQKDVTCVLSGGSCDDITKLICLVIVILTFFCMILMQLFRLLSLIYKESKSLVVIILDQVMVILLVTFLVSFELNDSSVQVFFGQQNYYLSIVVITILPIPGELYLLNQLGVFVANIPLIIAHLNMSRQVGLIKVFIHITFIMIVNATKKTTSLSTFCREVELSRSTKKLAVDSKFCDVILKAKLPSKLSVKRFKTNRNYSIKECEGYVIFLAIYGATPQQSMDIFSVINKKRRNDLFIIKMFSNKCLVISKSDTIKLSDILNYIREVNVACLNSRFTLSTGISRGRYLRGHVTTSIVIYDVFGNPVNRASRLCDSGLRGIVCADFLTSGFKYETMNMKLCGLNQSEFYMIKL